MKLVTLLFSLGALLVGIVTGSLIWTNISSSPTFYLSVIFALGLLNLYGGLMIYRRSRRSLPRLYPSVDLADTFRAARAYGSQPPIFEGEGFQSRVFAVDTAIRINSGGQSVIVENWDGPEVLVRGGSKQVRLQARQIVRLKNPGHVDIENLDDSLTSLSACVLVHEVDSDV